MINTSDIFLAINEQNQNITNSYWYYLNQYGFLYYDGKIKNDHCTLQLGYIPFQQQIENKLIFCSRNDTDVPGIIILQQQYNKTISLLINCTTCMVGFDFNSKILLSPLKDTSWFSVYSFTDGSLIGTVMESNDGQAADIMIFDNKVFVLRLSEIGSNLYFKMYVYGLQQIENVKQQPPSAMNISNIQILQKQYHSKKMLAGGSGYQNLTIITYMFQNFYLTYNYSTNQLQFQNALQNINEFVANEDGSGGFLCGDGLLSYISYISLNPNPPGPEPTPQNYIWIIVYSFIGGCVLLIIIFIIIYVRKRKQINQMKLKLLEQEEYPSQEKYVKKNQKKLVDQTKNKMQISKMQFLARFLLVGRLGSGGFSSVYKYTDSLTNENVAVKIMTQHNKQEFEEIKDEIKIMLKTQNYENVVKIKNYAIEQDENTSQVYIVMELAKCTLEEKIQSRRKKNKYFSNKELLMMTLNLLKTLSDLQDVEKIVHRDIKPSNILYFHGKIVKISDFGCSKQYNLANFTNTKTMIGTCNFLSPQARLCYEIMTGNSDENVVQWDQFKSDVFSLGLTLLYAATYKPVLKFNIDPESLKKGIEQLEAMNEYSQLIIFVIKKLLVYDEQRRPTFSIVYQYLKQELQEQGELQQYSIYDSLIQKEQTKLTAESINI